MLIFNAPICCLNVVTVFLFWAPTEAELVRFLGCLAEGHCDAFRPYAGITSRHLRLFFSFLGQDLTLFLCFVLGFWDSVRTQLGLADLFYDYVL